MYYVYILASRRHGTLYIGVTNSIQKRLEQHRNGKGSSFVKQNAVYRLVYVEACDHVEDAIAREKQLKRWKRDWKIELIERENLNGATSAIYWLSAATAEITLDVVPAKAGTHTAESFNHARRQIRRL
jgi:putative endonuclease